MVIRHPITAVTIQLVSVDACSYRQLQYCIHAFLLFHTCGFCSMRVSSLVLHIVAPHVCVKLYIIVVYEITIKLMPNNNPSSFYKRPLPSL